MAEYRSTGRELRKSPRGVIAGVFALVLAAGVFWEGYRIRANMVSLRPDPSAKSQSDVVVPATETTASVDDRNDTILSVSVGDIRKGALILVNDASPTEDMEDGLVSVLDKRNGYLAAKDKTVLLRQEAMEAVNQVAAGFHKATAHTDLVILNGYRTKDQQKKLYENGLKKTGNDQPSAYSLPGCSDYESGYTLDFGIGKKGKTAAFTGEDDYAWIAEHCAEYGFVRRYPPEKATMISPVDKGEWAFRYVGLPHSMFMKQNSLCLEEYLDLLESYPYDGTHLFEKDALGRQYEIYYFAVDPNDTAETVDLPVPRSLRYTVSGNNRHGFIVTIEMPHEETSWNTSASPEDGTGTSESSAAETAQP